MCRIAIVKTTTTQKPENILNKFSKMSEQSKSLDGDWQGDGWGISWFINNKWERYTSLSPIWKDFKIFSQFPRTNIFVIHSRSASFVQHKGIAGHNQPYVDTNTTFAFNGLLKGVRFPRPLIGEIGAQKIWGLFKHHSQQHSTNISIKKTIDDLNKYTKEIQALNLSISDGEKIYVYTQYNKSPKYYNLQAHITDELKLICSEKLDGYNLKKLLPQKLYIFE